MRWQLGNILKAALGGLAAMLVLAPLAARAQVGITNGLTQEKSCKPGEAFESFVTLRNNGPQEETVRIYQTDYTFTADGKSYYDAPGKGKRSNAAWVTVASKQVTIPGLATLDVKYTCRVPANPALAGTYWSIVMFEVVPKAERLKRDADKQDIAFGVSQVMRYGVQIVTHLGETGARSLKFLSTELLQTKAGKTLQVDLENDGERWLRPFSTVEVYSDKGDLVTKIEGERWRLFPGTSARFKFDVSALKPGAYNALIVFDNKDSSVFGVRYDLTIAAAAAPKAPAAPIKKATTPAVIKKQGGK
jgi:hypothetical protein